MSEGCCRVRVLQLTNYCVFAHTRSFHLSTGHKRKPENKHCIFIFPRLGMHTMLLVISHLKKISVVNQSSRDGKEKAKGARRHWHPTYSSLVHKCNLNLGQR
jgi:hypothetical protein